MNKRPQRKQRSLAKIFKLIDAATKLWEIKQKKMEKKV